MIPGPLLFIGLPLAAAVAVYAVRRWNGLAGLLATLTTAILAWVCWRAPLEGSIRVLRWPVALGQSWPVLDQTLSIAPLSRALLLFLFAVATVLFLFAGHFAQGRSFFAFGLAVLGVLSAAVTVRPFTFAFPLLGVAAAVAVYPLQAGQPGSTRGALRFLVLTTLGLPWFLPIPWLLDKNVLNPQNVTVFHTSFLLAAVGFAFLLSVVPFHTWLAAVGGDAPPVVAAFVFVVFNAVVLYLLLTFFRDFAWVRDERLVWRMLTVAGTLMAAVGGVMAFPQRRLGRLLGYAALVDVGCILVALGTGTAAGWTVALAQVANRAVGLALAAMGLAVVRHRAGGDEFTALGGLARAAPLATAGLLLGGLSLGGVPLTAGFPARWALYRMLFAAHPGLAVGLLLAGGGVAVGFIRGLGALLRPAEDRHVEREPVMTAAIIVAVMVICVGLGLYPQWLLPAAERIVTGLSFLSP